MSSHGNSRRCMAIKPDGDPCRAWAIRGSDPPRCAAHSGKVGAPSGNQNALNRVLGLVPRPNLPARNRHKPGDGRQRSRVRLVDNGHQFNESSVWLRVG